MKISLMEYVKLVGITVFGIKINVCVQLVSLRLVGSVVLVILELNMMELIVFVTLAILEIEIYAHHVIQAAVNAKVHKLIHVQHALILL